MSPDGKELLHRIHQEMHCDPAFLSSLVNTFTKDEKDVHVHFDRWDFFFFF